jgi:hypothetical protein
MHGTQAVLKSAVIRSRIYKAGKAKLFNVPKSLKPWMLNDVEYEIARDAYESIDRIINDLSLICFMNHQ